MGESFQDIINSYYKDNSVVTDIIGGYRNIDNTYIYSSGSYDAGGIITFDDESLYNTSKTKVIDALKEGAITYSATGSEFVDWELVGGKY